MLNRALYRILERYLPLAAALFAVAIVTLAEDRLRFCLFVSAFIVINVAGSKLIGRMRESVAVFLEHAKSAANVALMVTIHAHYGATSPFWLLSMMPLIRSATVLPGPTARLLSVAVHSIAPSVGIVIHGSVLPAVLPAAALGGVAVVFMVLTRTLQDRIDRLSIRDAFFENCPIMLYRVSSEGRIVDCNRAVTEMLGYDREELIGAPLVGKLYDDKSQERSKQLISDWRKTGQLEIRDLEMTVITKGGERIPVSLTASLVSDTERRTVTSLSVHQDIRHRKKVDAFKDEFVATVSHELRTPLTSIYGSLGLIEGGVAGEVSQRAKELTTVARTNCDRLIRIVNDLLDFQQLQADGVTLERSLVSPPALVREALESLEGMATSQEVVLRSVVEVSDEQRVLGDPGRLVQVLVNLGSNAIKVSSVRSTVDIGVRLDAGGSIRFWVRDNGPGIAPDKLPVVFERFRQLDGSDNRQHSGTGLGLPIAKGLVERHGGRLCVESRPNEGALFYFELPGSGRPDTGLRNALPA